MSLISLNKRNPNTLARGKANLERSPARLGAQIERFRD